jgi:colicin import membrane protein
MTYDMSQPTIKPKKANKLVILVVSVLGVLVLCGVGLGVMLNSGDTESRPVQAGTPAESPQESPARVEATQVPEEPALSVSQEQAVISAESYLSFGGFSRSGLIEQLEFEGFSNGDAEFAVDSLDVDWNEQAVRAAESYMEAIGGFSREGLIEQLQFDGFTTEQAEHGADEVGL